MITVIGMGCKKGDLTMDGMSAIKNADVVVVKSKLTHASQTVEELRKDVVYCDYLYEQAEDFDHLNKLIAEMLNSYGNKNVAFCVVGSGAEDTTVQMLSNCSVIAGVPFYSSVIGNNLPANTLLLTAEQACSATRLYSLPTIITCVDDQFVASDVQLKLLTIFDEQTPVVLSNGQNVIKVLLSDLCKQQFCYQSTLFISPMELTSRRTFDFYDCADIMAKLRAPDGCPWDREQTHHSIIKNVIEEAYELADALERDDLPHIVEELGDLLMQVIFHLQIGYEEGEFETNTIFSALCCKLIDRHPHVFAGVQASNSTESLDVWNKQKQKEHKIVGTAQNVLDVPRSMTALMRCQKISSRASKGGYEFESIEQIAEKVTEELNEFLQASQIDKQMEGGDLLFAVVNLLRLSGVDSETALLVSTEKFVRRVVECERLLGIKGLNMHGLTAQQFDELWFEAKKNVG